MALAMDGGGAMSGGLETGSLRGWEIHIDAVYVPFGAASADTDMQRFCEALLASFATTFGRRLRMTDFCTAQVPAIRDGRVHYAPVFYSTTTDPALFVHWDCL